MRAMTDELFADYLRSTHQNVSGSGLTDEVRFALGGFKHRMKELSADPAINQEERLGTESGPTTLRELKDANNRLFQQYSDFLETGAPLDFKSFVPELKQHSLLASGGLELISSKHPSTKSDEAFQAASCLCSAADALSFAQHAYTAGFEKANDIAKVVSRKSAQRI